MQKPTHAFSSSCWLASITETYNRSTEGFQMVQFIFLIKDTKRRSFMGVIWKLMMNEEIFSYLFASVSLNAISPIPSEIRIAQPDSHLNTLSKQSPMRKYQMDYLSYTTILSQNIQNKKSSGAEANTASIIPKSFSKIKLRLLREYSSYKSTIFHLEVKKTCLLSYQ